jgi:HlyD family secretion protein
VRDSFDGNRETPAQDMADRLGLAGGRRKAGKPWWKKKRWWFAGGGLLLIVLIVIFSGGPPKLNYVTQSVTKGDLTMTVSATGTLAPRVKVTVGAEVSGRIDALYVDFNDRVKQGQKIAQINTESTEASLSQARAALAQAQATLVQSDASFKRAEALIKSNALSQQEFDTAKADNMRAKAGVAQAAAQVQAYETQLTKATIYAPIDGVVLDRKVAVGQTVAAAFSTPELFTIASDLTQMELDVNIDEADVGTVRTGQTANFTVDAYPDKVFEAKLVSVHNASETVQNVVTYKGVLLVKNNALLLKPGMTATAEIITGRVNNALLVPNAALRFVPPDPIAKTAPVFAGGAGTGRVWTVAGPNKLVPHDLLLGGTNGRFTVVKSGGLKPGDKVVTDSVTAGGASVTVSG